MSSSFCSRFVINLLVTNLVTCWALLPRLFADNLWKKEVSAGGDSGDGGSSMLMCAIFEGIAIGLCVACVLSVLMIGIDQYFAVIDPLRYHSSIKATTTVIMIVLSWTVAACFGVFGGLSVNQNCTWYVCEYNNAAPMLPASYQIAFSLIFVACAFVAPFAAICWIYVSICSAARENHQRTRRNGSSNGCVQEGPIFDYTIVSTIHEAGEYEPSEKKKVTTATAAAASDLPKPLHHSSTKSSLKSTSSSIVNSLRHRISNASMFRYREETRAARISVLVIVMALFCWLPFTLLLLVRSPLLGRIVIPHYIKQIGILSLSSNAVVSPLIFAHRNRRIHRELCKLFRVSRRRTSFYDNMNARRHHHFSSSYKKRLEARHNQEYATSLAGVTAVTIDDCLMMKNPKKCVSILNRVWHLATETEHNQRSLKLPEVALETDTSRSSFSSNASSGSNPRSTSAASISDAVEEV